MPIFGPPEAPTTTPTDLEALRRLAGVHINGDAYTDAELAVYLDAVPQCSGGGQDVYLAAADLWTAKAEDAELADLAPGSTAGPLVTAVRQGDASITYARPTAVGASNGVSAAAMRQRAARMRRRSCTAGANRAVSVLPPEVLLADARGIEAFDGTWPAPATFDPFTDPASVNAPGPVD